jgi:hypothetical protein
MNDSTHPMKVETKTQAGELVAGAECKLSNDYGTVTVKSGDTTQVRRSGKDLDILCKDPKNPDANARAISRANGGMWGNIILGGGIAALGARQSRQLDFLLIRQLNRRGNSQLLTPMQTEVEHWRTVVHLSSLKSGTLH